MSSILAKKKKIHPFSSIKIKWKQCDIDTHSPTHTHRHSHTSMVKQSERKLQKNRNGFENTTEKETHSFQIYMRKVLKKILLLLNVRVADNHARAVAVAAVTVHIVAMASCQCRILRLDNVTAGNNHITKIKSTLRIDCMASVRWRCWDRRVVNANDVDGVNTLSTRKREWRKKLNKIKWKMPTRETTLWNAVQMKALAVFSSHFVYRFWFILKFIPFSWTSRRSNLDAVEWTRQREERKNI